MSLKKLSLISLTTLTACSSYGQYSAWLPEAGEIVATPGFVFSTFDEFWMGRTKVGNPPNGKSLDQYTGYLGVEYGILHNLAADVTVGYTKTDTDAFGADDDDGIADTYAGLRYRLWDERDPRCPFAPTISIRGGGIIAGTYDENQPFSAGDGAHGAEGSLLLGKTFGETGLGMYADIGYRWRENPVPDDIFGSAGFFQRIGIVTLSAGYRHIQGLDGLDIGGAGFNPPGGASSGFPALKEVNQLIEGAVTISDNGGRQYQFTVAKNVDGRNTGDKLIFGFNVSFAFGGSR